MKLRNIFTMLAAALAFTFVGCEQPEQFLDEIKVSKSYISLPVEGGDFKLKVNAVADWSIVAWDAEQAKAVEIPSWLTVEPLSGSKGETEVTLSAEATTESHEVSLYINCGTACQMLKVVQVTEKPEPVLQTCDWINKNAQVGVSYRVKGAVTKFGNFEKYGSFYINDGTAEKDVYIYGSNANKVAADLELGDVVTIEGPWSSYKNFDNGTIVVDVEKGLIKVEKMSPAELDAAGDVFTVILTNKGEGLTVSIPEADQAWLSVSGDPLVLGTTTTVELKALANSSTPRTTTVSFSTVSGDKTYTATVQVSQKGGIPLVSVKEAIAMPADSWVMVSGIVSGVHKKGVVVTDEAGDAIYAYVNTTEDQLGAALGDKVNVIGKMGSYANFYQIVGPQIEVLSSGNKVKYPTPVALKDAASFETYKTGTFSSIYVEATGVTTGQYGDIKIGEWTVSPYQTSSAINIADFKDKEVKVTGYLVQYKTSPETLRVMLTSVELAPIYEETFAADKGEYTIDDKNLGSLSYVWSHDAGYKYMKASGYNGGGVESWLVSPEYDLAGQESVYLSFDHILNYLKGATRTEHVNVLIKETSAAEWTSLEGITWPEGTSWTAVNSGKVDLSAYAGKKIQIAFKYTSTASVATTWEVYNVKLTRE